MATSDTIRFLYPCDHKIITYSINTESLAIVKGPAGTVIEEDKITISGNLLRIVSITTIQEENTASTTLSPEIYGFNPTKNTIRWFRNSKLTGKYAVPVEGETYTVTFTCRRSSVTNYDNPLDCDRCRGNNIYTNILGPASNVQAMSGPYLVAQDFLKCLLTVPGTDPIDPNYGSGIFNNPDIRYFDDTLQSSLRACVSNAADTCRSNHMLLTTRSASEKMKSVTVDSIELDTENSGVYLLLTLQTQDNNKLSFGLTA